MWHVGLGDITGAQIATKVLEAERERHIREGKATLDAEINKLGEHIAKETIANQFGYSKVDDFFALVGSGEITAVQIKAKILDIEGKKSEEAKPRKQTGRLGGAVQSTPVAAGDGIDILGGAKGAMAINLARCCNPAQGDSIVGYITRNRGITVHRADCSNVINSTEPDRLINVTWGRAAEQRYRVPVLIIAYDREGLMRDIGAAVANESINMTDVNITTRSGVATFNVTMEIEDVGKLTKVLSRLEQLPNVVEARRKT
jgi:GTP pyrophosphokinase